MPLNWTLGSLNSNLIPELSDLDWINEHDVYVLQPLAPAGLVAAPASVYVSMVAVALCFPDYPIHRLCV